MQSSPEKDNGGRFYFVVPDLQQRAQVRISKKGQGEKLIILTIGQAQRIEKFMDWAIETFKHQADEINPDNYSPELQDAIELQKIVKKELEANR